MFVVSLRLFHSYDPTAVLYSVLRYVLFWSETRAPCFPRFDAMDLRRPKGSRGALPTPAELTHPTVDWIGVANAKAGPEPATPRKLIRQERVSRDTM